MLEFLRDGLWQSIGAILGLIAIIVAITTYVKQRRLKQLSYEVISNVPLVSVKDEVRGKVEIRYNGEPVEGVSLIIIKVVNSGNVPIIPNNYIRPISFDFGEDATILSVEILEEKPTKLGAISPFEGLGDKNKVEMNPVLLNGGDAATFKVLGCRLDKIDIDGRITGIKTINLIKQEESRAIFKLITSVEAIGLLGVVLLFGVFFSPIESDYDNIHTVSVHGDIFGLITALIGLLLIFIFVGSQIERQIKKLDRK